MTVSTEDFRWTYTSTGGTTYQYLNKILTENDLTVYVDDVLQAIGTDYSVTGVGTAAGGNVVFGAAPAAGSVVLITKDGIQFTQEHDYTENDPFPAASHEDALDKQTNLAQRIWDYVRRSVKVAITSTLTDLELPTPSAGKYLGWNDTATGLSNLTPIAIGSISDDAYSSTGWDGASEVAPSKNAVRDKIEAMISDTTYSSTWDSVTTIAPSKNAVYDKIETLMNLTGSNLAIGSDADGDMYYRASSALARLAKGTANYKMFMNAGATAPEWAKGMFLGGFHYDISTTGDASITGVGFKPGMLILISNVADTSTWSIGIDDGTSHLCLYNEHLASANLWSINTSKSIEIVKSGSDAAYGLIKSFDADGFTYTKSKSGSPTGNCYVIYLALR